MGTLAAGVGRLPLTPLREDKAAWLAMPLWRSPAVRPPSGEFQCRFSRQAATAGLRTVGDLLSRPDGGVLSAVSLQRRMGAPTVTDCNRFLTMLHAGDFVQPRALRALGCAAGPSRRLTRRGSALPSAPGCSLGPIGTPLEALGAPLRPPALTGPAFSPAVDLLLYFACLPVSLAADGATCKLGAALAAPPAAGVPAAPTGPPAGALPAARGLGRALWGMHGRLAVPEDLERAAGQGSVAATFLPQLLFLDTVVRRLHHLLRRRPFRLSIVVGEPRLSRLLLPHGSGSGGGCLPRVSSLVDAWLALRDALSAFPQWHVTESPAPALACLLDAALPAWRDPLTAFAPPALRTVPAAAALDSAASAAALGVALAGRWPAAGGLPSGEGLEHPSAVPGGLASSVAAAPAGALVSLGPFCGVLAAGCHRRVAGCPGFLFEVSSALVSISSVYCFCCLWPPPGPSAVAPVVLRPPLLLLRSPDAGLLSLLGCSKGRAPSGPRRDRPAGTGLGCGRISAVYSHRLVAPAVAQALGVSATSLLAPWRSRVLRAWPVSLPSSPTVVFPVAGGPAGSPAGAVPAVSRSALVAAARRPLPWLCSGLLWRRPGLAAFADLTWRLLFGKLAVLQRLHWLSASQRTCPICTPLPGAPTPAAPLEDEAHAFAACGQAQAVWAAVAALWGTFPGLPSFPFTDLGVLVFGAWPGAAALPPPGSLRLLWTEVAMSLLDVGRHLVWLFRGEALAAARPWRPSSGPPTRWHLSHHRIRAAVLASVSRHVRARFLALPGPAFLATWGLSPLLELAGPGPPEAGPPAPAGGFSLPRLHCPAPWPEISLLPLRDAGGVEGGGGGGSSGGGSSGFGGGRSGGRSSG